MGDMERKNSTHHVIFSLLAITIILGAVQPAFAATPGDMYAGTGRVFSPEGVVYIVSQTGPIVETFVGDPTAGTDGLTSLAIDSTGKLFGTTLPPGGVAPSNLLQINPNDGSVILDFGTIEDPFGVQIRINDLAILPGFDAIVGVSSAQFGSGQLYGISQTSPPIANPVGPNNGLTNDETPIGFAPDGTLYMTCFNCASIPGGQNQLLTVNPNTGAILTQVSLSQGSMTGLGVRDDGVIFGTGNVAALPFAIYTISTTGTVTLVGVTVERYGDLDFFPSSPTVGGSDVSINTSALLLAGVQSISMWMIPVVIAGAGIGLFVIKRRNSSRTGEDQSLTFSNF